VPEALVPPFSRFTDKLPEVMLAAFVVSVVADAAKATPLVFVTAIAPADVIVASPLIDTKLGLAAVVAIKSCPLVPAAVTFGPPAPDPPPTTTPYCVSTPVEAIALEDE